MVQLKAKALASLVAAACSPFYTVMVQLKEGGQWLADAVLDTFYTVMVQLKVWR